MDDKISKGLLFLPKSSGSVLFTPWSKAISTSFQPRAQHFVTDTEHISSSEPVSAASCPTRSLSDPASSPAAPPDVSRTSHPAVLLSAPERPLPTPRCGQASGPAPSGFPLNTPGGAARAPLPPLKLLFIQLLCDHYRAMRGLKTETIP